MVCLRQLMWLSLFLLGILRPISTWRDCQLDRLSYLGLREGKTFKDQSQLKIASSNWSVTIPTMVAGGLPGIKQNTDFTLIWINSSHGYIA
jgi:hypothetical protein